MEEQLKMELERAKMTNYILQKENEILLKNIHMISLDKKTLMDQIENSKRSIVTRVYRKVKRKLRRNNND